MKKLNTGLSGCKLEFVDNNLIRKYSSSSDYNNRLSKQIDKQVLFSNFILKNIDTPKIHNVCKDKIYSFDMEYISGLSFNDYFSTSNISDIDFVIQTLFSYFDFLISSSKTYKINNQVLEKLSFLERDTRYKKYVLHLKEHLSNKTIFAPKSFCHGDLTFTNILFHKNRLFFIDFLDSYVDSFICDLVKLKQDLYYFWSLNIQKIDSLLPTGCHYNHECQNRAHSNYHHQQCTQQHQFLDQIPLQQQPNYKGDHPSPTQTNHPQFH